MIELSHINFQSILESRGLKEIPLPLWKLKLTDDEFASLRKMLAGRVLDTRLDNPFFAVCKESALFFAEFWRRLYISGVHSKQMVFDALGISMLSVTDFNSNPCNLFYDAACRGAKMLGIERYAGGRADLLDDMLYQGGLPLSVLMDDSSNIGRWERIAYGLVNGHIDFECLNLGVVASQSRSMKEFSDSLVRAIEYNNYELLPFWCKDENNPIYVGLKELAKKERRRRATSNPFNLQWIFDVDTIENRLSVRYLFSGKQSLSQSFLSQNELDNVDCFTVQVRRSGQTVDAFNYHSGYCRYEVRSVRRYSKNDTISIYLSTRERPVISEYLDLSIPHLLARDNEGLYYLGNKLGLSPSLVLIPVGWHLVNADGLHVVDFDWNGELIKGVELPYDYSDRIILEGPDGKIEFGQNVPIYWTEICSAPLHYPEIIDSLYNARDCHFKLCSDQGVEKLSHKIEFRSKYSNEWRDEAPYGEIFARVSDSDHFVTHQSFINIGEFSMRTLYSDKDICRIQVKWPYGHVSVLEGVRKVDDIWEIQKEECADPRRIRISFTPNDDYTNKFTVSLRAPFKYFSIFDKANRPVKDNACIPYSDLDTYDYHIVGDIVAKVTYGNSMKPIRWIHDATTNAYNLKVANREIPFEGSLATLFESHQEIDTLLARTSQNMLAATVKVCFTFRDGREFNISIKRHPYLVDVADNGEIRILDNQSDVLPYKGSLELIPLSDPYASHLNIRPQAPGLYVLPQEIKSWGKTLLWGSIKGRIRPTLVDLNLKLDKKLRYKIRKDAENAISQELSTAHLGDEFWQRTIGWFELCSQKDIPASSLLELIRIASDANSLIAFLFQLYIDYAKREELEELSGYLTKFTEDLAFQWFWLMPYLNECANIISNHYPQECSSSKIWHDIIQWYLNHLSDTGLCNEFAETEDSQIRILMVAIDAFQKWLRTLCVGSALEFYDPMDDDFKILAKEIASNLSEGSSKLYRVENRHSSFIDNIQDEIRYSNSYFDQYSERGKTVNENWMYQRVNALAAHFQKKNNLFNQSDEIRRSVIYCTKSLNDRFLLELNNKLAR